MGTDNRDNERHCRIYLEPYGAQGKSFRSRQAPGVQRSKPEKSKGVSTAFEVKDHSNSSTTWRIVIGNLLSFFEPTAIVQ